ncbi:barstar family protein [Actinoplanes sp. CA-252034]|uniref:barstar family protein n=1 Tax=Actinoplanes sp. CA-252034 TaxID=3239906 RepID=UPI003D998E5E
MGRLRPGAAPPLGRSGARPPVRCTRPASPHHVRPRRPVRDRHRRVLLRDRRSNQRPGGYFGWNLDALDECLPGRFGAVAPFRLVWHDSAVAREHLVAGYDPRRLGPAITLDYLLDMLEAHHVKIDLR